jgi:hypothetical protein
MLDELKMKLDSLEAMLAALTGSMGVDELNSEQLGAYLVVCQRLAFEACAELSLVPEMPMRSRSR